MNQEITEHIKEHEIIGIDGLEDYLSSYFDSKKEDIKQIISVGSNASTSITGKDHSKLINLDYASSGHTGFETTTNKSTDVNLGVSDTLYPTQNAVKTYVDTAVSVENLWDRTGTLVSLHNSGDNVDIQGGGVLRIMGDASPSYNATGYGMEFGYDTDETATASSGGDGGGIIQSYDRDATAWRHLRIRANEIGIDASGTNIIKITSSGLNLVSTAGTASGGLLFGTDTNLYRSAANILKTDDSFQTIAIGIGVTPNTSYPLYISAATANTVRVINTDTSGSSVGGAGLQLYEDDGAAMATNDRLGAIIFGGAEDTSNTLHNASAIISYATENWTASANGSRLSFETTADGGTSRTSKMTILGNGDVGIGTSSPTHLLYLSDSSTTASRAGLYVTQTGAITGTGYAGYFTKTGASTTNVALYANATGATNNYAAIFLNGSVGLGTSTPRANLDVVYTGGGEVRVSAPASASNPYYGRIRFASSSASYITYGSEIEATLGGVGGGINCGDLRFKVGTGVVPAEVMRIARDSQIYYRATASKGFYMSRSVAATASGKNLYFYAGGAKNGTVTAASVVAAGSGYTAGDVLTLATPDNSEVLGVAATVTVDTVDGSGGVTGITITTIGACYVTGTKTTTGGTGTGCTISVDTVAGVSNTNGGDLGLYSGISTGTGTSKIVFYTCPAGSSGTADNTQTLRMTILGNGNVGMGVSNPGYPLEMNGTTSGLFQVIKSFADSTNAAHLGGMKARGTIAAPTTVQINDQLFAISAQGYDGSSFYTSNVSTMITMNAAENFTAAAHGSYITFATTPTGAIVRVERMRIDSTGYIGIGTTSPATVLHAATTLTTSLRGVMSSQHSTTTDGARFHMRKSRGTNASPTVVVAGDMLGRLVASGYDGSNYIETGGIGIEIPSAGTIASTRVPSDLVFYTGTDAAPTVITERIRINSAGSVMIGTTTDGMTAAGSLAIAQDLAHRGTKIGFFNTTPVVRQTELTDELTTITHTAPSTPDYAIQDLTNSSGYGFVTKDEGNTVLSVIANLQARVNELETKLVAYGLLADAD